jgi:ABC-type transport system substrate-binding protein
MTHRTPPITRRRTLQALAAAPFAGQLAGFDAAVAQQPNGPRVLHYAFEVAESGFDPAPLSDLYSRVVTAHIFENLYRYDHLARPFRIRPCTAAAMPEVSNDFRVWTIRLRPGIYFADDPAFKGIKRELVAEDYVYTWKRIMDPRWKAPSSASMSEQKIIGLNELRDRALKDKTPFDYTTTIEGLRALDKYTLQFRLEEPRPRFLQLLAGGDLWGAVAREVVEMYGDDMPAHPVGTGPFRLAEWRRSSRIVLERNPNFRDAVFDEQPNADDADGQALLARLKGRRLPMVDRVVISVIEEVQPRWLSFLQKQQDVLERLPWDFIDLAAPNGKLAPNLARDGVKLYRVLASDVTLTYFNMEDPVIGGYTPEKVALRRAISLAFNLDQEVRLYWRNQAVIAQSALVPNTMGYDPNFISENGVYDLARARALLDTFGYLDKDGDGWREQPDGSPLALDWATTPDQRARSRDELRRKDMNALGIKVNFRPAKWPENLKSARAGKLQIWSLGSSAASPDGQPALYRSASVHKGGQNLARFSRKEFDEVFNRMTFLPDGPERDKLFLEAKRITTTYVPYKHHVHRILTDLAHPWVEGFRRPPYWLEWWTYVDIDPTMQQRKTT